MRPRPRTLPLALPLALATLAALATPALAAPKATILRIDPRASMTEGAPVLTTVLDIVQPKRVSEVTADCARLSGDSHHDCVSERLSQPRALYSPFPFPEQNALFTIKVDGVDAPLAFAGKERWGDAAAKKTPGVGTAWLLLVDAAATMGKRFDEAKAVASTFVQSMGPSDIVDVMFFNDRAVVKDSKWTADKNAALAVIQGETSTYPTQGRTRPLFNIIKQAATDGFGNLGNYGTQVQVPLHQAMVVLSNGVSGADPSTNAASAGLLRKYLTDGRFPEENTALPKTPVPVVSVWFPSRQIEEFAANAREFMEALPNVEIGGYYSILRDGHGARAGGIVSAVRRRFDEMHIVKWRVSCVAPTITQSFNLAFMNTQPEILPDGSFKDVPVGIDPRTWPLDIDRARTEAAAKKSPVYPGGSLKIYGNFCWGGDKSRAELYLVPKNQPAPPSLGGANLEQARQAQQTLIQAGLKGRASEASASYVEFDIPSDATKALSGKGEQMSMRLVVYDNKAARTSPVTADQILTLRARETPFPILYVVAGGVLALLLALVLVKLLAGGGRRRQAASPPPRPIVAGSGSVPAFGGSPLMAAAPAAAGSGAVGYPGAAPPYGVPSPQGAPADPYGAGAPAPSPYGALAAVLWGSAGTFRVLPGQEVRAGRDPATCAILLAEPRVSGTHTTLKVESNQLYVRDEGSNNGTFVNGNRVAAGVWTVVPPGATLKLGPVEFAVRME